MKKISAFIFGREAAHMGEYAAVGAMVLLAALAGFQLLGVNILAKISEVAGAI
jgi:hypothetical protein